MKRFLPVLLGTDLNAYGMARAFHEEYGVSSLAVGEIPLLPTKDSKIVQVKTFQNFTKANDFIRKLDLIAKEFGSCFKQLLLIPCGDVYARLMIQNQALLARDFVFSCIDKSLREQLDSKEAFYEICEEHGLDIPKTVIVTKDGIEDIRIDFSFPVILKPSNSVEYLGCRFEGKKKAFMIDNKQYLKETLKKIYNSGYQSNMVVQEFISGADSSVRVLNCYVSKDSKVKLMCLGRPLLEDKAPGTIGNYLAIVNSFDKELCLKIREFLEKIKYKGFANFDFKYDERDGKFKIFEINLRQGRSSYFVTGSGFNLAKYIAEDLLFEKEQEFCLCDHEHLWLGVPKRLLFSKLSESDKILVRRLIKEKKVCRTLFYKYDNDFSRKICDIRFFAGYYKSFRKYF